MGNPEVKKITSASKKNSGDSNTPNINAIICSQDI